jgi:hypothetical protein
MKKRKRPEIKQEEKSKWGIEREIPPLYLKSSI